MYIFQNIIKMFYKIFRNLFVLVSPSECRREAWPAPQWPWPGRCWCPPDGRAWRSPSASRACPRRGPSAPGGSPATPAVMPAVNIVLHPGKVISWHLAFKDQHLICNYSVLGKHRLDTQTHYQLVVYSTRMLSLCFIWWVQPILDSTNIIIDHLIAK